MCLSSLDGCLLKLFFGKVQFHNFISLFQVCIGGLLSCIAVVWEGGVWKTRVCVCFFRCYYLRCGLFLCLLATNVGSKLLNSVFICLLCLCMEWSFFIEFVCVDIWMLPYKVCPSVGVCSKENEGKKGFHYSAICSSGFVKKKINLGTKDKGHGSRFNSRMRSKAILGLHLTLSHAEI